MPLRRRVAWCLLGAPVLVVTLGACGDDDAGADLPPEAAEGRRVALRNGCTACHGADGGGGTGPAWVGAHGSTVELEDGSTVVVDDEYLTTAIADPDAQVHAGFSIAMPDNQLSDEEIAEVVAYIRALGTTGGTGG
jgi:cytochrome c oxidase subunit 2